MQPKKNGSLLKELCRTGSRIARPLPGKGDVPAGVKCIAAITRRKDSHNNGSSPSRGGAKMKNHRGKTLGIGGPNGVRKSSHSLEEGSNEEELPKEKKIDSF